MKNNDTIDVVITWVNGNDPDWRKKKKEWAKEYGLEESLEERYRDWNNLKYLFRGIEKNMPWVNKIYLITDNQKPEWLNEKNDRISVIDHTDIIPSAYLPTFSSHVIEMHMHRIEGLSNKFIYFNDDIFVLKETKKEDFFVDDKPKDHAIAIPAVPHYNSPYHNYLYNDISIINQFFNYREVVKKDKRKWLSPSLRMYFFNNLLMLRWRKFSSLFLNHLSISFRKDIFADVYENFEEILNLTFKNKFRQVTDNSVHLMRYWQIVTNNFEQQDLNFGKLMTITDENSVKECVNALRKKSYKVICINDNEGTENFEETKEYINKELHDLFPEKSEFEK